MALSARAQAIIEAAERDARARREALNAGRIPAPPSTPPAPVPAEPTPAPAAPEVSVDPERILELVEEVGRHAAEVRARAKSLDEALDLIALSIGMPVAGAPATPPPARRERRRSGDAPQAAPPQNGAKRAAPVSDSARLVAVEMAVAGHTRDEVRHRLASEYGVTDTQGVLDDVFGQGTAGSSRMPWS